MYGFEDYTRVKHVMSRSTERATCAACVGRLPRWQGRPRTARLRPLRVSVTPAGDGYARGRARWP